MTRDEFNEAMHDAIAKKTHAILLVTHEAVPKDSPTAAHAMALLAGQMALANALRNNIERLREVELISLDDYTKLLAPCDAIAQGLGDAVCRQMAADFAAAEKLGGSKTAMVH
jgi:ABC-type nitrate/sulfonate/bicarbonate transport system ATPase subunit